jgi:hypothetical protein
LLCLRAQPETRNQEFFMSFMLKIAFALQVTVAGAVGLGTSTSTSTSAPTSTSALTEQAASVVEVDRPSCEVCDEVYDNCIAEGLTPAGCTRLVANCRKNCLP